MNDDLIWRDVSNEIERKNSKENPFGWSQSELWHDGKRIGFIECGVVDITDSTYRAEKIVERDVKRLMVRRSLSALDWQAVDFVKAAVK